MKRSPDAILRNGRPLTQTTLDDYDNKTFHAYYDTTAQFKRYSETIDQHVKRRRQETKVIHSLETGSTIEIHDIERSDK